MYNVGDYNILIYTKLSHSVVFHVYECVYVCLIQPLAAIYQ